MYSRSQLDQFESFPRSLRWLLKSSTLIIRQFMHTLALISNLFLFTEKSHAKSWQQNIHSDVFSFVPNLQNARRPFSWMPTAYLLTVHDKVNKSEHFPGGMGESLYGKVQVEQVWTCRGRGTPVEWGWDWGRDPAWVETDMLTDSTENSTFPQLCGMAVKNFKKQEEDVKCQEAFCCWCSSCRESISDETQRLN